MLRDYVAIFTRFRESSLRFRTATRLYLSNATPCLLLFLLNPLFFVNKRARNEP